MIIHDMTERTFNRVAEIFSGSVDGAFIDERMHTVSLVVKTEDVAISASTAGVTLYLNKRVGMYENRPSVTLRHNEFTKIEIQ